MIAEDNGMRSQESRQVTGIARKKERDRTGDMEREV